MPARPLAILLPGLWAFLLASLFAALIFSPSGLSGAAESGGFDTGHLLRLTANSVFAALLAALIGTAWMLIPALVAARLESGWRRGLLVALAVLPLFISPTVIAVAGIRLFGPQGSLSQMIAAALDWFGLVSEEKGATGLGKLYSLPGTGLLFAWSFASVAFLALMAVLAKARPEVEEAGRLETSPARVLLRLVLPMAVPGFVMGGILVFLLAMTEFGIPEALRSQPLLVSNVYTQFGVYYDGAAAAQASFLIVLLSLPIAIYVLNRLWPQEQGNGAPAAEVPPPPVRSPGLSLIRLAGWSLGGLPAAALLGVLLVTTRGPGGFFSVIVETWDLSREEFFFSLMVSAIAAALCAVAGVLAGLSLASLRKPAIPRLVLLSGLVLPGPVIGIGLKVLLLLPPGSLPFSLDDGLARLDSTLVPLVLAYLIRFTPLVALLCEYLLRDAPRELAEATRLESNRWFDHLRVWGWASIWPGVVAGGLAGFALIMGEAGAAVLVIPPGPTTLSVRLMTLMHYAPTSQVSALSLLIVLPALLVFPLILVGGSYFTRLRSRYASQL